MPWLLNWTEVRAGEAEQCCARLRQVGEQPFSGERVCTSQYINNSSTTAVNTRPWKYRGLLKRHIRWLYFESQEAESRELVYFETASSQTYIQLRVVILSFKCITRTVSETGVFSVKISVSTKIDHFRPIVTGWQPWAAVRVGCELELHETSVWSRVARWGSHAISKINSHTFSRSFADIFRTFSRPNISVWPTHVKYRHYNI